MFEDDEKVENAMSLSFLDVISCGMVSSIFLAIIFSVIGYTPAISLRTKDFIAIILEIEEGDTQVWNIALKPPRQQSLIPVLIEDYDMTTGCYTKDNEFFQNIQLFGVPHSDYTENGISYGNYRIFFISKPTLGKWEVACFISDANSSDDEYKTLQNVRIITSSKSKNQLIEPKDEDWKNNVLTCSFEF